MQGNIVFNGYDYAYRYDKETDSLQLRTQDKKNKIEVEFICRQTGDTERRWREFQRMFAESVAKNYYESHS